MTRAHVFGRYLSCPFLRILPFLPEGRILDIGAGHGTLARLAVEEKQRTVVALEPDLRKSFLAYRHPQVHFVAGFDEAVGGRFDAVSMIDVLYRVPRSEWPALFSRIRKRLEPGGIFLLKELDPEKGVKFLWNRIQEAISDGLLGLSLGEGLAYANGDEVRRVLEEAGFARFRKIPLDRGYPHSHVLYVAERSEAGSDALQ